MEEAFRCGLEQAEKILQDICWEEYEDILFVSKSIGTVHIFCICQKASTLSKEYFIYTTSADIFICRWEWDCISWNGRPVG